MPDLPNFGTLKTKYHIDYHIGYQCLKSKKGSNKLKFEKTLNKCNSDESFCS